MVDDRLFLEDVRFFGRHGITTAEQTIGAWFSVDVEITLDLSAAARTDSLGETIDYGAVARRIVEIGMRGRVNLLERLAGLIADELLRETRAGQVRVRVRKLTPPLEGLTGTPGVGLLFEGLHEVDVAAIVAGMQLAAMDIAELGAGLTRLDAER